MNQDNIYERQDEARRLSWINDQPTLIKLKTPTKWKTKDKPNNTKSYNMSVADAF